MKEILETTRQTDPVNYFKSLFYDPKGKIDIPLSMETGPLDYKITQEELTDTSLILKLGKAPWLDNVLNEMILCSVKHYPHVFLYLFNLILKSAGHIPTWALSLLVPKCSI